MACIIADNILDSLICDSCKKYLSVKPIKVYSNNDVRCGRCSKDEDEGYISVYDTLAEKFLFKCINRLDGCNKLLSYLEVQNHEKECVSQLINCPVCPEEKIYPTYKLRDHFKQHHPKNYLHNNWFFLNMHKSFLNTTNCYLYNLEDNLYFIYFRYDHGKTTLSLNVVYIGKPQRSKQIIQKFIIHCNSEDKVITENQPCTSYYMRTDMKQFAFNIQTKDMVLDQHFIVEFNINAVNEAKLILLPNLHMLTPSNKKFLLKKDSNSELEVSISGTALIKLKDSKKLIIFPQCQKCGCIELINYYNKGAYLAEHDVYNYICFFCRYYYNEDKLEKVENLLPPDLYKMLEFYCKWNCNYTQILPYILMHEEICSHQVSRVCPVKKCMFFGKLFEIRKHFKTAHSSISLQLLEPLLVLNSVVQSPKQCYVLVCDKFVWTEYFWDDSILNMNIAICEDEDTIKPIARIFDLNNTYFGCFDDRRFSFNYKYKLLVKIELKTFKK